VRMWTSAEAILRFPLSMGRSGRRQSYTKMTNAGWLGALSLRS
jgi:hypothetical protein